MSVEAHLVDLALKIAPNEDALSITRLALFDWAVCAIAGRKEPVAQILRDLARKEQTAGSAVVVGGGTAPSARAALINGATSHALDYDDTHFGHIGHTSVAVMPAILSVSADRSMDDVLAAALIGSEAAIRTGLWLGRAHYQKGFHQTATAGAFGATIGVCRLLGLQERDVYHALGLAATKAAGLKSQFGTMGKPLNAGLAAETGVLSAQWAQAGLTSTDAGLQGPRGFGETHHGIADLSAFHGLGETWQMMHISHKFHACCHGLHAMLEALRDVSLPVSQVTIYTHPRWMSVCNNPAPRTGLECKFSYKMTAAMRLSGIDTARIESFTDTIAQDTKLRDLAKRINVMTDDQLSEMQCRVVVVNETGVTSTYAHDLNTAMPFEDRHTRLKHKACAVLGQALCDEIWTAVHSDSARALNRLLQSA